MRESRGPQIEGSVSARSPRGRRLWAGSLALLLPLVLVLVAVLAPSGQAHPAKERTPEELASRAQSKLAEKEQHAAQRQAQRELQAKLRGDGSKTVGRGEERENGLVKITCTQVSWTFKNFPDLPGNTVTERLSIGHAPPTFKTFTFDGTTGTDVVAISAPPAPGGHAYQIDAWGKWTTNGFHGAFDIHAKVKCAPDPALAIEKLQKIAGTSGSFTTSPLTGSVGQTVDYEILLKNTGNVPLSIGPLSDPRCDEETISGGPGTEELAPAPRAPTSVPIYSMRQIRALAATPTPSRSPPPHPKAKARRSAKPPTRCSWKYQQLLLLKKKKKSNRRPRARPSSPPRPLEHSPASSASLHAQACLPSPPPPSPG